MVEGGRPTWVRLFAYFTRSAVATEMDVLYVGGWLGGDVCVFEFVCVCVCARARARARACV